MVGRVFLGLSQRTSCSYFAPIPNLREQIRHNSYSKSVGYNSDSTSKRVEITVKKNFKVMQNPDFEQFKRTKVKSFEKFKQSPRIIELFEDDTEKVLKAYEDYCVCKFNRYRLAEHGGNPGTMI